MELFKKNDYLKWRSKMKKKFKIINLLLICIILTATVLNPIVFATKINFQVNEPNLNDDSISRDIIMFAEHNFKNQINDFILNSNFYEVTVTNKYDVHLATPMRVYDYNIDNMTLNATEIYYFPVLEKNELIGTYAVAKLENGILSGTLSKSFADKFNYLSKNNYKPGVHKLIRIKSALFLSNNSSKVINELESDTPSNLDIDKYKEDIDKKIETLLDKSSVEEYSFESIIINSNLIFSDPGAPVDYKYLSVPIVLQNGMNWCWAATCASILNYRKSLNLTASEIVTYVYGSPINQGGAWSEIKKAYNNWGLYPSQYNYLTYSQAKSLLKNNIPIHAGFYYSPNNWDLYGHSMTIRGFEEYSSVDKYYLLIDPNKNYGVSVTAYDNGNNVAYIINGNVYYLNYARY